jgi:hypothetical protein
MAAERARANGIPVCMKRLRTYGAVSLLALAPCFWQERIQAGDLSSHLYNAWLAQLIARGAAPGLALAKQSNNVAFDLMLSALLGAFGPGAAERIAVSVAVLIFFWGAFALVWSFSRREGAPWDVAPCLAMLAYGWVFHQGLFNFYVSLGLGLGAMALMRRRARGATAGALGLLAIAYTAHPAPAAFAAGAAAYDRAARALAPGRRVRLFVAALLALAAAAVWMRVRGGAGWSGGQAAGLTGADQILVFGIHYTPLAVALLAIWILWFQRVLQARRTARTLLDIRFELCLLCAAGVVILPAMVRLPGMENAINVFAERMSLATAVMFCGLTASVRRGRAETAAMAAIAVVFFACLYTDERALNRVENQMARLVEQIPPGQRVVSTLADPNSRVNSVAHLIDRACVGRCFSYGNYEPSTAQFRVRAQRENGIVVSRYVDSSQIQSGGYVVEPRDLPLYKIELCQVSSRELCIVPLAAGAILQNTWLEVGPVLGKWDRRRLPMASLSRDEQPPQQRSAVRATSRASRATEDEHLPEPPL